MSRSAAGELLSQVLSILDVPAPSEGFGALRLWGQTGTRPGSWVAAADPVYLEARLDHLVLHRFDDAELGESEIADLFDHLQENLAADGDEGFLSKGRFGYIHRTHPMEVAGASPELAQGSSPEEFLPSGRQAKAHDRLQSEVQMSLFGSAVNERRANAGKPPVSGLWMWGGGIAPTVGRMPLPPLYANDPLLRGYWLAASAAVADWTGNLESCLERSPEGFVAALPTSVTGGNAEPIDPQLAFLRRMLRRGRLRAVTLVTGGGLRVEVDRWSPLRLWRRELILP